MTLEELNARISALDDCHEIVFELYLDSGCDNMDVTKIFETLLQEIQELRDWSWNEFAQKINDMSKQA